MVKALILFLTLFTNPAFGCDALGIRNHNPGNISTPNWRRWKGAIGCDDRGYLIFKNDRAGLRALRINLRLYASKHHIRTVDGIVRRWAKLNAYSAITDRRAYEETVCDYVQVLSGTPLAMEDVRVQKDLGEAIILAENGCDPYSKAMLDEAFCIPKSTGHIAHKHRREP